MASESETGRGFGLILKRNKHMYSVVHWLGNKTKPRRYPRENAIDLDFFVYRSTSPLYPTCLIFSSHNAYTFILITQANVDIARTTVNKTCNLREPNCYFCLFILVLRRVELTRLISIEFLSLSI